MRIVIGAAAGNVGRQVTEHVLRAGEEPLMLVRNPAHVPPHLTAHARMATVDLADPVAVAAAARGADALFWVIPPFMAAPDWQQWYRDVTAAGVAAVRENRIARVVLVSSLGAGMAPGLSTVSYIGETETAFNATETNVVHLRPGYFMENFLLQAEAIRTTGLISLPFAETHTIPWVSTNDIGEVAARYLLDPTWAGQWTRNLMGPANLTLPQCAAFIAAAWGQPVRYERQSDDALRAELMQSGASAIAQQELMTLLQALGDPAGAYATPRTPEAVTRTSFEAFVREKLLPRLQLD